MWQYYVIEVMRVVLTWALLEAIYGDESWDYYGMCEC
jgi:hypothetical protein